MVQIRRQGQKVDILPGTYWVGKPHLDGQSRIRCVLEVIGEGERNPKDIEVVYLGWSIQKHEWQLGRCKKYSFLCITNLQVDRLPLDVPAPIISSYGTGNGGTP